MTAVATAAVESPIGRLYLDAQRHGQRKARGQHTSEAEECGCAVSVSYFSGASHSTRFEPCPAHPIRPAKR